MPRFVRRFRRRAGLVAALACVVLAGAVGVAAVLTADPDLAGAIVAWSVTAALVAGAAAFAITSVRRSVAIREVQRQNPGGLVYLARRQPALISDLETYLGASGVASMVADRWVVGLADERGLAAWNVGRDTRELLLVPWADMGAIEPHALENGRLGVAVDVKPFETPLVVSVGYSAFGVLAALDRAGVAEVVDGTNAFRPG